MIQYRSAARVKQADEGISGYIRQFVHSTFPVIHVTHVSFQTAKDLMMISTNTRLIMKQLVT